MALIFQEGFEGSGSSSAMASYSGWSFANSYGGDLVSTGGRFNTHYISSNVDRLNSSYNHYIRSPFFTVSNTNTIRMATWIKFSQSGFTGASGHWVFRLTNQERNLTLAVNGDLANNAGFKISKLQSLYTNVDADAFRHNTPPFNPLNDQQWHHLEFHFVLSTDTTTADGKVEGWLDGYKILEHNNVITSNSPGNNLTALTTVEFSSGGTNVLLGPQYNAQYDDVVIWDDTSPNMNTRIGLHRIKSIFPTANGNYRNFSGFANTGGNWAAVDEGTIDGDTSYVEGFTAGNKESFQFSNLNTSPSQIFNVTIKGTTKNPDIGTKNYTYFTRVDGADANVGNVFTANATYQQTPHHMTVLYKSPSTNSAWTSNDVANAEFGISVES